MTQFARIAKKIAFDVAALTAQGTFRSKNDAMTSRNYDPVCEMN